MFPEVFRAVRELRPRVVLIENVKGLMRQAFSEYFEYIYFQLSHPGVQRKPGENWADHRSRLEKHHTGGHCSDLEYRVVFRLLNAAEFGVPQKRERVFFVGFRSDLGIDWAFPEPSHSLDSLLVDQWVTGEYWERHGIARKARPATPLRYANRVRRLQQGKLNTARPWSTVRDAIIGLPEPSSKNAALNHWLNPGARSYHGHTGSPLDEPAKTLKAGDHGVPGGENMLAHPDGSVRYFTVREAARLQTFPDDYGFQGPWSEAMRQLGNAVPVKLAELLAADIRCRLLLHEGRNAIQPAGQEEPGA
ncbi:MAG TPA: DNA cytosine methyltransferase, partial [Dongiaceae bacterium]|nr:DNA cytosine methyltransferase [Dongiaceae bacterium]